MTSNITKNIAKYVIIYLRVSWSKQSKYGESLEVQEENCRAYCERNGYVVLAVFKEQFTGTKDKRPTLHEALEFVKNSELQVSYSIVYKIDRVSRGWIKIHESFKQQFESLGVTVRDTLWVMTESRNVLDDIKGIDTNAYDWAKDTTNKLGENVSVMMSENERHTILQRMLGQSMRNGLKGFKIWDADFGFSNKKIITESWKKKTIQVDNPSESQFIKKMYELFPRGDLSKIEIVEEINLMGYKSRVKTKWNHNKTKAIWTIGGIDLDVEQLNRYIVNPIYAWIVIGKWTGDKAIKAPYAWLVSVKVWNSANRGKYKIIENRDWSIEIEYYKWEQKLEEAPIVQKPKTYKADYPFSKVLECPKCKWTLTAEKSRSKNGTYHHYYSCRGKKGAKHKNYSLRRDEVNERITTLFSSLKFDKKSISAFNVIATKIYWDRKEEHKEKENLIHSKIKNLEIQKNTITQHIQNIIEYPDLLQAQNEKLQEIKMKMQKLQKEKIYTNEKIGLTKFKQCSKKILEHLDILVLQKENPELIQLIFDITFGGKVQYDNLNSRTPILQEFLALNTKKEFQNIWNSSLNDSWWVTDSKNHTLKDYIVNLIDMFEKWEYVIDRLKI